MLCDSVSGAQEFQAEHLGAARTGGGGRRAHGHVGGRGGVRARRAGLEPRARPRQLYTHCFLNYKVKTYRYYYHSTPNRFNFKHIR